MRTCHSTLKRSKVFITYSYELNAIDDISFIFCHQVLFLINFLEPRTLLYSASIFPSKLNVTFLYESSVCCPPASFKMPRSGALHLGARAGQSSLIHHRRCVVR